MKLFSQLIENGFDELLSKGECRNVLEEDDILVFEGVREKGDFIFEDKDRLGIVIIVKSHLVFNFLLWTHLENILSVVFGNRMLPDELNLFLVEFRLESYFHEACNRLVDEILAELVHVISHNMSIGNALNIIAQYLHHLIEVINIQVFFQIIKTQLSLIQCFL